MNMANENRDSCLEIIDNLVAESKTTSHNAEKYFDDITKVVDCLLISTDNRTRISVLRKIEQLPIEWRDYVKHIFLTNIHNHLKDSSDKYAIIDSISTKLTFFLNKGKKSNGYVLAVNDSEFFDFYKRCLEIFTHDMTLKFSILEHVTYQNSLHNFMQMMVIVSQNTQIKSCGIMDEIRRMLKKLITSESLQMETLFICCLLFAILDFEIKDGSTVLQLIEQMSETSDPAALTLCRSVVVVYSKIVNKEYTVEWILKVVFGIFERNKNDTIIVHHVSKFFVSFGQQVLLSTHVLPQKMLEDMLLILWTNLDHPVDSIKHTSMDALNVLICQKDESILSVLKELIRTCVNIDRKTCKLIICLSKNNIKDMYIDYQGLIIKFREVTVSSNCCTYVVQAYVSLMCSEFNEQNFDHWFKCWIDPYFEDQTVGQPCFEHILSSAIKLSPMVQQKLATRCRKTKYENYGIMVKCALAVRKYSTMDFVSSGNDGEGDIFWKGILPKDVMEEVLYLPSCELSILTATLIIDNRKMSETVNAEELRLIKIFIDSNMANQKSAFRQQFLTLIKKLCLRLKILRSKPTSDHLQGFTDWLVNLCFRNVFMNASYPRRYTALELLSTLHSIDLWSPSNQRSNEIDMYFMELADTYDENRELAKTFLIASKFHEHDIFTVDRLKSICDTAVNNLLGYRFVDHTSAAYLLKVLCSCNYSEMLVNRIIVSYNFSETYMEMIDAFRNRLYCMNFLYIALLTNLLQKRVEILNEISMTENPIYGILHGIRHLFGELNGKEDLSENIQFWRIILLQISKLCISSNLLASPVVSSSNPEGYVPFELLESEDEVNIYSSSQKLLLCSWRTVKEASLLLSTLVEEFSIQKHHKNALFDATEIINVADHLKMLIFKIRHRGAFEQLYLALCQLCSALWRHDENSINSIPRKWLADIVHEIVFNSEQLCSTRRSAGLPFIVQAVLCAEMEMNRKRKSILLQDVMKKLCEISSLSEHYNMESKIHALNVLRSLFRNRELAENITEYVEEVTKLAILGFASNNWPERNSCTLLFSALITRIFGVSRSRSNLSSKNKMTGKSFFRKYSTLYEFFLEHLEKNSSFNLRPQSTAYPILLIFARLYPSTNVAENGSKLTSFLPHLYRYCECPVLAIRTLAVSSIVPFIRPGIINDQIDVLWNCIKNFNIGENALHGFLLLIEHLIRINSDYSKDLYRRFALEAGVVMKEKCRSNVTADVLLGILILVINKTDCADLIVIDNLKPITVGTSMIIGYDRCLDTYEKLRFLIICHKRDMNVIGSHIEQLIHRYPREQTVIDIILYALSHELVDWMDGFKLKIEIPTNRLTTAYKRYVSGLSEMFFVDKLRIINCILKLKVEDMRPPFEEALRYSKNPDVIKELLACTETWMHNIECTRCEISNVVLQIINSLECRPVAKSFVFRNLDFLLNNTDDVNELLQLWTFILEEAVSLEETDVLSIRNFVHNVRETVDSYIFLNKLMLKFIECTNIDPRVTVLGLVSWICSDLVVHFHYKDNKVSAFKNDLPDYYQDREILIRLSRLYFNRLCEEHPSVVDDQLEKGQKSYVMTFFSRINNNDKNINSVRDVIDSINKFRMIHNLDVNFIDKMF